MAASECEKPISIDGNQQNNKLALLVGDYQSDSDNEDTQHKHNNSNDITTDWTQCTDASTGHPYYWNIVTKDVTWEMPTEYQLFLEQSSQRNPHSLKKWIICYTDDNAPYYFNEVTREISWEKPHDFIQTNTNPQNNNFNNDKNNESKHLNSANNDTSARIATNATLNLVPEYNSDDSDDESSKPTVKPLFPSSSNTLPSNCLSIKPIEISNDRVSAETDQPNSPKKSEQKGEIVHKEKPSFASIITGGRSPQHETIDITQFIDQESDESVRRLEDTPNETELSQKTFQRKRRIEFNVSGVPMKRTNQTDEPSNVEPVKDEGNSIASLKAKYSNFQKGETEFVDKELSTATTNTSTNHENVDSNTNSANVVLRDEQQLLEEKLKFLCQGRADVSPVQVIQIQLQALQAAHLAEALHSDYLLEWMKNISNDLIKLESDAAPNGWKCLWNREKALYCYENTTTGEIKWEYPELEVDEPAAQDTIIADDAMDICTTPPPNEHEDLSAFYQKTNEYHAAERVPPSPATWTAAEPVRNEIEKPLDDELASFYSDIAKLEPETTNDDNSCDKSPSHPDQSVSPEQSVTDADDKKKKKKKKTKKLEPWRSGNLETWINKWQKAQKELDG